MARASSPPNGVPPPTSGTSTPARILTLASLLVPAQARWVTEVITLQPGWNAVWLQVDPTNRAPASVFANFPLASAWTWSERLSATDFIQNPERTGWNRSQWLAHFASDSPEARLANLFAVLPQRAYLLKIDGIQPVPWRIQPSR